MILGAQTVTVTPDDTRDRHGDPVDQGQPRKVKGCKLQPLASQEMWEGPEGTVTVSAVLFAPVSAALRPREHVRYGTDQYRVVGKPQPIPDLHGVLHHYEVRLREVRGPIKDAMAG